MPKPLDPDKRAAIEQAIRDGAGTRSAGSIAREHGVSRSTVCNIARDTGQDAAFGRAQTKNATRARTADMAARRSQLASDILDDAEFVRAKFRQDWTKTVVVPGREGSVEQVDADSAEIATGLQRLMTAVGIAVDKHLALDKHDREDETGAAAVDAWLRHVIGSE